MCIALKGLDGKVLEKKCTTGAYGEPFLTKSKQIEIPFATKEMVKTTEITFSESFGQIAEIFIERPGGKSSNYAN